MGGAQPLAVTMNGGTVLCIECDPSRAQKRLATRYLDVVADDLEHGIALALDAKKRRRAVSIAVIGNAAEILPELLRRGVEIDIVTDQTSAHDPLAYLPIGVELEDWHDYAAAKPEEFTDRARASMATHVEAMVGFQDAGAEVFDYGNSIRGEAQLAGYSRAFDFPGFVPAYIRPLFCAGKGPFRWAALSGDPADIHATDRAVKRLFPDNDSLQRWMRLAPERIAFQGLPARICWLGAGERDKAGLEFNSMVASGELSAPVVIGRDHLDAGSVASPYRETEAMADGSDAIADWPLLNALVSTASGASWVSIHHGGGVGIGRSIHAGQVTVADGTELAAQKVERVLTNDPAMGVLRHVDAGYPEADTGSGGQPPDDPDALHGGRRERRMRNGLQDAEASRFGTTWADLAGVGITHVWVDAAYPPIGKDPQSFSAVFAALHEDLNTPAALGALFKLVNRGPENVDPNGFDAVLFAFGLKLDAAPSPRNEAPADIKTLAEKRWAAKQAKDFVTADALRKELTAAGWSMLDRKDGYSLEPLKK